MSLFLIKVNLLNVYATSSIQTKGDLNINSDLLLNGTDILCIEETIGDVETSYKVSAINTLNGVGCYFDSNGNASVSITKNGYKTLPTYAQILEGIPLVYKHGCNTWYNKGKDEGYDKGYEVGYNAGYLAGKSDTPNAQVEYEYHDHKGVACTNAAKCTKHTYCQMTAKIHGHSAYGGSCYTGVKCGGKYSSPNDDDYCRCNRCGDWTSYTSAQSKGGYCTDITSYNLTCGYSNNQIEYYYCTLPEGTIISAKVNFY